MTKWIMILMLLGLMASGCVGRMAPVPTPPRPNLEQSIVSKDGWLHLHPEDKKELMHYIIQLEQIAGGP